MALETATQIQELVDTNPEGIDTLAEADNHLRMIKTCVQTSLPGMTAPLTFTDPIKAGDPVDQEDLVTLSYLESTAITNIGFPMMWMLDALPVVSGQEFADLEGQEINRLNYPELFALYGVTYGVGDGTTTFNLPDLRGQFLRGVDNGAGNDPDSGSRTDRGDAVTGDFVGTKQSDEFGSHIHDARAGNPNRYGSSSGSNTGQDARSSGSLSNFYDMSAEGGNETRPININVRFIMRIK